MLPWCLPTPQKWKRLALVIGLLGIAASTNAQTNLNQTRIAEVTEQTRNGSAPAPTMADMPGVHMSDNHSYLLTVKLGGLDAVATEVLLGITQAVLWEQLQLDTNPDECVVVEAANVTICVNGSATPAPSTDIYFSPTAGQEELSGYLRQVWKGSSDAPAPPFNSTAIQHNDFSQYTGPGAGRKLLDVPDVLSTPAFFSRQLQEEEDEGDGSLGCYPECQITMKIFLPIFREIELWNETMDFFASARFLAKMKSEGLDLVNAQLLGYQEPIEEGHSPMAAGPTGRASPSQEIHTFGPGTGDQNQNSSALEFSLSVVGDAALATNDSLLGALYDMIVMYSPSFGSSYVTSENTAITFIRQGPPQSVGVALGRRLLGGIEDSLLSSVRRLLQQGPPPLPQPGNPVNEKFNVTKPSLIVTFRLRSVPIADIGAVKEAVASLLGTDNLIRGFQSRGISVYQVTLQSFNYQPGLQALPGPQMLPGQAAPPPMPLQFPLPTRKPYNTPRDIIIVVAVVPVSVLAIALGIFAVFYVRRQKRRGMMGDRESTQRLKMKESQLSGGSSFSDQFSDRQISAAAIIRRMHPQSLSQSFLDMTWNDWRIDPAEITILTRPDGGEWLLGSGASGRVYKALRNGVQIVAVKLFKEEMTRGAISSLTSPKHAEQFRREINILKTCHDKNIVQFLGACLTDAQTILVTEFLDNGDLYNAINSQQGGRYHWYRMPQPDGRPVPNSGMARRVALDVARGLHFLHTKKIVHFDLKSANILLARDFTAKIADVGLARILQDDVLSTRKEVGTFAWAAPEVLLGQRTTEAADIYSFGVLLHELSALESPTGRHLRRLRVPEECPPEVSDLMFRCLDPNQYNRPSARDLVANLTLLPPVPPFPPPPQKRSGKESPSHSRHNSFSRASFSLQCQTIEELWQRPGSSSGS